MHRTRHPSVFILTFLILFLLTACLGAPTSSLAPSTTPETNIPGQPASPGSTLPASSGAMSTSSVSSDSTPSNDQINIIDINSFKDDSNYWYFFGLVRNDTKNTVYDVQVDVKLLDDAGNELYTYTTGSMFTYLQPGEVSPFSDFTPDPYPYGHVMQAKVASSQVGEPMSRAKLDYRGITLWSDDRNDVFIAGEVYNGNATPVEINTIAGSLVDSSGKLVTTSAAYPNLIYIEPGKTSPFVMMFDAPAGLAAKLTQYSLYTDALTTGILPTYDITVSEKQRKYQDANGDMHLVGAVTNNTSKPMNIYLLAGMYDQDGNVLDANVVYPPLPINPGVTFPYDFNLWGPMDYVPAAYEKATDYKIFIDWLSTAEATAAVSDLSTKDDTSAFDGITSNFKGIVVNDSGKDITTAFVSVALYDNTSGDLIATNLAYVSDPLPSGGNAAYEVSIFPPNDIDPAKIKIVISAFGQ